MIYMELSFYDFKNEFKAYGREEQFSEWGLKALYNYLSDLGTDINLDVIALCCGFVEYDLDELKNDYSHELLEDLDPEELEEASLEDVLGILENDLTVISADYNRELVLIAHY